MTAAGNGQTEAITGRRWRSPRPRESTVVLSLPRRWIVPLAGIAVVLPIAAFAIGWAVGQGRAVPQPAAELEPTPVVEKSEPPATPAKLEKPVVVNAEPARPIETKRAPELDVAIGAQPKLQGWALQVGAFPELALAEAYVHAHAADLIGRKIYIIPTQIEGRGTWHRVRIGSFAARSDAEASKKKLTGQPAKDAIVVNYR